MKEKKRIEWLDILKGICMFFIVLSHSQPPVVYIRFYTPFFLAGFFFCSGYTFSAREDFTHFLLHKARTILVPYWGFGLINAVMAYIADGDNLCDRIIGLLLSINQRNDDLWFVMCLFTMEIIFYLLWILLFKDYEARRSSLLIIAVGGFALSFLGYAIVCLHIRLLFQFETALIMLPFMLMGYVWKKETKVNAVQKTHKIMGGGIQQQCVWLYI